MTWDKYQREYYYRHKSKGLCIDCPRPALPGLSRCKYHHEKMLEAHRRYYKRNREKMLKKKADELKRLKVEHRCRICFNKLPNGYEGTRCPDCMDYHAME